MISHIITPDQCAACRLCCQFTRASQWETPSLTPEQVNFFRTRGIPLTHRKNGSYTFALQYDEDSLQDTCAPCPLLDHGAGCTLSRQNRPIECRIWPLRLMNTEDGSLCIAIYRDCPAFQNNETRERLIREASGPLLPFLLHLAKEPSASSI